MGAAGLGLFDSDHDFDSISELNHEAGLHKLAAALHAKERAKKGKAKKGKTKKGTKVGTKPAENGNEDTIDDGHDYRFSLHGGSHELNDEEFLAVREHLESGVLDRMINERLQKVKAGKANTYPYPGYELVLLAVCAMEYGCHLSESFLDHLRRNIRSVGLMRDAVKQVDVALNDPVKGYKNDGIKYELAEFPGFEADQIFPGGMLINTPAPFGWIPARGAQAVQPNSRVFADGLCGGCGAHKKEDGGQLMKCANCKDIAYCCKECQKSDWKRHKAVCKPVSTSWASSLGSLMPFSTT